MFDAILLGFVQGLTEFLPVSSSAHLSFFQSILGWQEPDIWFDILLHFATLIAVLLFFKKDIFNILTKERAFIVYVAIASVPTAVIGILLKDFAEQGFSNILFPAFFLIITGIILYISSKKVPGSLKVSDIKVWQILAIGTAQGLAVFPGISRSGATIAVCLLVGMKVSESIKFSFLLSVPAILGALVLGFKDYAESTVLLTIPEMFGMAAALISGYFAIYIVFKTLINRRLVFFAYYCWAVGIFVILFNLLAAYK